ncbi:MAG: formylmethanofuran dehydrogenase subunit E family protein [Syntrophotaleaceae bacterium]
MDWSDMPTITIRLPGKVDAGWKERCTGDQTSYKCSMDRFLTLTVADMEKYYGEVGPGLAFGYRACQIAFSRLYPGEIPTRGDLFVVGSHSACPADPVTFITGVRYGKDARNIFNGDLVFDEKLERFSFIFVSQASGKAVKLTCRYPLPQDFLDLMIKKNQDPSLVETFWTYAHCLSRYIFTAPETEIFEVTPLDNFDWKQYLPEPAA